MRSAVVLALLLASCARGARVAEMPPPVVASPPVPPVSAAVDTLPPVDTVARDRVPAFRALPLVTWGPIPPGERHAERTRAYDLQHQVTRIRFDWARHAVVGSTTIRFAALGEDLGSVSFDAVGMTIRSVRTAKGAPLEHTYDGRSLVVELRPVVAARSRMSIVIDYETERPKKGVYFIDRRHTVWTQGGTEDTRHWVPTYDHPNDKTTWEFYITTRNDERALSNGRLVSTKDAGGSTEWHWSQGVPASTYLMSVVTGDYVVLQDVWREVPIGYWTYPDSIEAAWRGFGRTPRMVDLMSNRTGLAYPWAKYDQSVVPDYIVGGMENVTATTHADDGILHPAWAEPEANADALVAHELAHQWYGNYLTARDWAHAWLNEGFATFFESVLAAELHGRDAGALARLAEQEATIEADRAARRPLVFDRWVRDPLELFLSGHVHARGATVLQMLRRDMGESKFWAGIKAYTRTHALGSVVTDDFQRAMERESRRDLSRFFAQWIHGAGIPAFQLFYAYDSAARSLALSARQVHPLDSLTGFFQVNVVIEVLTDAGRVVDTIAVRDEVSDIVIALPAPPRAIRWDKGGWLADVTDFPRPTALLAYQLRHDDDILGRIEAADLLGRRTGGVDAREALTAAIDADSAWAVRGRAASALGYLAADSITVTVLLRAAGDRDSRVRAAAVSALGVHRAAAGDTIAGGISGSRSRSPVATPRALGTLRRMAAEDSSPYVRGAALIAYARLDPPGALAVIEPVLTRDSWLDLERTQGVHALAELASAESWSLLLRQLEAPASRQVRCAVIAALMKRAGGREPEVAVALAPLLAADDLFVRSAAARALGVLGQASSIPVLEARQAVEAESRVINVILGALAALRSRS